RWTEDPIAYVWGITPATRRAGSSKDIRLKTRTPPNAMDHAVSPGGGATLCNFTHLVLYAATWACQNVYVKVRESMKCLGSFCATRPGPPPSSTASSPGLSPC